VTALPAPERALCVWCPDWPVATARRTQPARVGVPVVTVQRVDGRAVVTAASAEARAEGVVAGLRRREAEARCPGLVVVDADPAADARAFEAVARAVEAITPRLVLERPGVLTLPTRGPSRYFGGDATLARHVLDAVRSVGVDAVRVGVADGAFAARLAARALAAAAGHVVDPGGTPAFLAPWPVAALGGSDAELAGLLVRLGLPTLGAFAGLPASAVLARFGPSGARAHRLAAGLDEHATPPAPPPPDLVETAELDPPATRVDEAAFVAKGLADRMLDRLGALGLSCARVVVEAETEHGEHLVRCWRHEGTLTAAALAARVRWQLEGWLTGAASDPRRPGGVFPTGSECDHGASTAEIGEEAFATGGLTLIRLTPEQVVPADGRQLGFWGGDAAARDRADRALARLQGLLGHDAVVTAAPCGGRTPAERVRWIPWGDARDDGDHPDARAAAWPGAVPGPAPARVYAPAVPADLLDPDGRPVAVSARGEATGRPARLTCAVLPGGGGPIRAWAGPWVHDVRWWDRRGRRRRALWHVVVGAGESDTDEVACLVGIEGGRASVEAVYD
jgi:protein ImuB